MKFQIVLLLLLCGACFAGETVLWRLGRKDGKQQDFQINYSPWEYGRAPYLRTNPDKKGFDPRKLLKPGYEAIKAKVKERMEVFGSIGKANY